MQHSILANYILAGAVYGFVRKTADVVCNNPQVTLEHALTKSDTGDYSYVSRNRSLLCTEKIGVVRVHTFVSSLYSPLLIAKDLAKCEAGIRGIDTKLECKNDANYMLFEHVFT